jgi:demethylmenaquinone methyltransferase / 2-methoxy-6-polyprenyl-1,4-benzoquinol methylase
MAVDKSEARVRDMFGEIAPRYDLLNHLLSMGIDIYWRWRTVRKVPPSDASPILDLCTGTGDLALAYYQAGGGQTPVVGADFCHPMLVVGHDKARLAKADQVTFIEADAQNLPFPDNSFQIVSVAFGLRNVTDTDRGLGEMLRVCRSGGKIAVLEFSIPGWQPFRAIYGWYFRHVLPRIGQLLARNRQDAYHYLPESVGEFPCGEALAERMRKAGASEVRYFPLTLGIATLYVGTK